MTTAIEARTLRDAALEAYEYSSKAAAEAAAEREQQSRELKARRLLNQINDLLGLPVSSIPVSSAQCDPGRVKLWLHSDPPAVCIDGIELQLRSWWGGAETSLSDLELVVVLDPCDECGGERFARVGNLVDLGRALAGDSMARHHCPRPEPPSVPQPTTAEQLEQLIRAIARDEVCRS